MRATRLLPLIAFLALLIVAVVVFKRQPAPTRLVEEVGFQRLVPQALRADAIKGLELYQGNKRDEAIRLRRHNGTWVATSYYDAPVKTSKIQTLLDAISTLEGERRSDKADLLGDFRLEDGQALHLLVYTTTTEDAAVHLLAGKRSGRNSFMRLADDALVYSVNVNLHREAGLYGTDTDQLPLAKPWLDLQLQNIPKEQVTVVELHTPTRYLHFTRQQQAAAADSATTSSATPDAASTATAPWILVAPKVDYEVKQGDVDSLVSTLATLQGEDIVDPDKMAEYGLDSPAYRAILTAQPDTQEVRLVSVLLGHEVPEQAGKRYARLGTKGPVYVVPRWVLDQIFPKLGRVLRLTVVPKPLQDVTRLSWQRDGASQRLERRPLVPQAAEGESQPSPSWHVVGDTKATVDEQAVTGFLDTIQNLAADDWFETPSEPSGLEPPGLSFTLLHGDGQSFHLLLGTAQGKDKTHYLSLPETAGVFVVSDTTYKSVTDALVKLQPSQAASSATEATQP